MGGHGREFRPRGEQCRQMEYEIDFELGQNPLEEVLVKDGAGNLAVDESADIRVQPVNIERDDGLSACLGKIGHQRMPNLAVRARYEDNRFTHSAMFESSKLLYVD